VVKIGKAEAVRKHPSDVSGLLSAPSGRLKTTESSGCGSPKDVADASLIRNLSDGQSRREKLPLVSKEVKETGKVTSHLFVPVVSKAGKALMPCHPARARELVRKGKALRRFKAGFHYLQLTIREDGETQEIAVGIDPGSKREAFTVKSGSHTYLNVLSDAVGWVKDSVESRRNMRRSRRFRKMPCRKNRENRSRGSIPPSTKSRWQAKLRIVNILRKLYPIGCYVVEDIQARSIKGKGKWNKSFSPLEVGKKWFYSELEKLGTLELKQGYETKQLRDLHGLKKTKSKLEDCFSAHNVDSWVLANWHVGGHAMPENERISRLIPLRFHRRQLHAFQPDKGDVRRSYGSTMSNGLKRGSLVKSEKYGICYLGGSMENRGMSLHDLRSGKRLCQNAKKMDLTVLNYNYFRWYNVS
jgi:hypothetical protein